MNYIKINFWRHLEFVGSGRVHFLSLVKANGHNGQISSKLHSQCLSSVVYGDVYASK